MTRPSIPPRLRKPLLWLLAVLGLLLALRFTVLAPLPVHVVTPEARELTAQVYGNGTVEAKVVVAVSTKVTGRIQELLVDQGDHVKAGQLLATLEGEDFRQQVLQAQAGVERAQAGLHLEEANYRKAQASLVLAEKSHQRVKTLGERSFASLQDVDERTAALAVAQRELERSRAVLDTVRRDQQGLRANLAFAESRRDDMRIGAPQDGLIVSRDLEKGATAVPGLPIFHLADPSVVWVAAHVDESRRQGLSVGQEAAIHLRSVPGEALRGRVARIGLESDRVTEEIEVDVLFDPPLKELRLGEQADVFISTATTKAAISLPASAVTSRGKRRSVWVVEEDRLVSREIEIGIEDRVGFVEVLSGIDPGTTVAVAPPEKMMTFLDGKRVKVQR